MQFLRSHFYAAEKVTAQSDRLFNFQQLRQAFMLANFEPEFYFPVVHVVVVVVSFKTNPLVKSVDVYWV